MKVHKGIIGIGVDIIEIQRFQNNTNKKSFLNKIYTEREQQMLKNKKIESYAGNFAVKEAVVKALGTGFVNIKPTDIEILRNGKNAPYVNLYNNAKSTFLSLGGNQINVSISHNKSSVIGFVIISA